MEAWKMLSRNRKVYESPDIVALFMRLQDLQKPEETILGLLESSLRDGRVLDIGVGAGRTTPALSASAREYVGIDYSAEMIAACRVRFRDGSRRLSFLVCDVRDMRCFADRAFDVVLFSFNGLDTLSHEDRLRALSEIRRVCRLDGYFAFSTHNLQTGRNLFRFLPICQPQRLPHQILLNCRRRALNLTFRQQLKNMHAVFCDGVHEFRVQLYYIQPRYQIEQLQEAGFTDVRVFSLDGYEVKSGAELDQNRDQWLYFMCRPMMEWNSRSATAHGSLRRATPVYYVLTDSYPRDIISYFKQFIKILRNKKHSQNSRRKRDTNRTAGWVDPRKTR